MPTRWIATLVALFFVPTPSAAQSVADFYRGKTVTIVVSTSSGGGYDALARARHVAYDHRGIAGDEPPDVTRQRACERIVTAAARRAYHDGDSLAVVEVGDGLRGG